MRVPAFVVPLVIAMPVPAIAWAYVAYRDSLPQPVVLVPKPKVGLLDMLTAEKRVSIWFDYAREDPSLMERLADANKVTTLLVPLNSAVMALPYKPHQLPTDAAAEAGKAATLEAQELEAESNTKRWVESYVVPDDITLASAASQTHPTLLDRHSVTFSLGSTREEALKGWKVAAATAAAAAGGEGGAHVVGVQEGTNGKLMLVDGCIDI